MLQSITPGPSLQQQGCTPRKAQPRSCSQMQPASPRTQWLSSKKMPGILSSVPTAFSMMLHLIQVLCSPKINGLRFKAKAIHCSCLQSGHKALNELLSASPRAWLTGAPAWYMGHRELFGWLWVSTTVPQRWTKRPDAMPGTGDLV